MEAAATFVGPIRSRPAAVGQKISSAKAPHPPPPPCPARVQGGGGVAGIASHGQNPFGLKMVQKDPVWVHRFFGEFYRVLEFKMSVLGLGFYLACKTMFI